MTAPTPKTNGLTAEAADPGNLLLTADQPCMLQATKLKLGVGERLCITIRTPTTTLSPLLTRDQVTEWIDVLTQQRDKMSTLVIPVGESMPIRPPQNGNHP